MVLGVQSDHQTVVMSFIVINGFDGKGVTLEGALEGNVVPIEVDREVVGSDFYGHGRPGDRSADLFPVPFELAGVVVGHRVVRLHGGTRRAVGIGGATGTTDLDVATDATIADFPAVTVDVGVAARATVTIDATGTAGVRIEGTTGAGGSRVVVVRGRGAPGAACRQDEDHPDGEEESTHGVPPFSPRGPPPESQERTFEKQNPYLSGKLL